ncbi:MULTISPECIES: DUF2254 domain-containing protein [unclassified Modestobacter]|uniref:DUF2254 domain-containing protein n=1 Tax=unclassified Modestobacter TaxID=2643866 RepID=UPI0022AAA38E|nr:MULTISPECIES: DUF2254 domain-containing protein [unclassified Modestobacter]MCZ2811569.1 DUF2254 domain-containing protein [Modestobacter sp. VKM Ac-2979]MCZ2843292.1 DUF2254 domain-containing protein [Modestobacter sp. VKM Ac-2980]MCZ2848745.1 DUF2254 domain-containing protein [Modestobacter sp. VKM Ac-2978]
MRAVRTPTGQQVRASLWFWPTVAAIGSLVVAFGLLFIRPATASTFAERAWPGDASSAASLLQTVATASITALTLTLSLTVVALQLASQQFSPRLLRSFARDGVVQATVGVLISAFFVSLVTLRGIDPERPLPVLALLLSFALGLVSGGMLIGFIAHMVARLRVDNMMAAVHQDSVASMEEAYAPYDQGPEWPGPGLPGPGGGVLIPAWRSGFVRTVAPGPLVEAAREHGVLLRLGIRPGDSVVLGSPIATAFADEDDEVPVDALVAALREAVNLGFERTEEQDVAFGLRQLVDIALRAISPGVNDPTTAAEALGYCADLLVRLTGRRLGPQVQRDQDGVVRAVLPDRDLHYYLDLSCAQVRRFGRDEPTVLTAVLRLLRDVAVQVRDDDQRRAVADQVDLVVAETSDRLLDADQEAVRDMARRVSLALAGQVDDAYRDRAGTTRSI